MFLNFNIPEKELWWRPSYWPYDNKSIYSIIQRFSQMILESKSESLFVKELNQFAKYYRADYMLNCLKGEKNISESVNIDQILNIIEKKQSTNYIKYEIKIRNMHDAMCYIFPDPFIPCLDSSLLNVDLTKKLHELIGNGLWDNCGEFRTTPASPSNEDYEYTRPDDILTQLERLFEETKKCLKDDKSNVVEKIQDRIKIGAVFFTAFLDIHPFVNGNGRVARLLLSFILSDISVVPIALYNSPKSREIYLNCLRESRYGDHMSHKMYKPEALSAYILESILRNIETVLYILDLWNCFIIN